MSQAPVLPPREGRRFVVAVAMFFGASGMSLANWFPRIPETRAQLGLSYDELGLALFGLGGGAMLSMPVTGWLIGRIGSQIITRVTAFGFCAALPLIVLAPNLGSLAAALFLFGAMIGSLDVAMNSQAAHGEGRVGKRFLSMLHGMFSIGSAIGAGTAAAAAAFEVPLVVHMSLVAGFLAVSTAIAGMYLLPDRAEPEDGAPSFALPSGAIWWLGIVSFCALLSEGAVGDWSAVFLRDAFDAGAQVAALGFGGFALTMTAGRLAGDRVVERYGAVPILRISGALTAGGIGLTLVAPGPALAIIGFALAGLGISVVFPIMVRAASRSRDMSPGAAIAAVSTTGYTGFLTGPPAIGLLSEAAGLRWGLAVLVVLGLAIAILAAQGRSADRDA